MSQLKVLKDENTNDADVVNLIDDIVNELTRIRNKSISG